MDRIYERLDEMQAEIESLKTLICSLESNEECICKKCWCYAKFKELGGKDFDFDWRVNRIREEVNKLWIDEKRSRFSSC